MTGRPRIVSRLLLVGILSVALLCAMAARPSIPAAAQAPAAGQMLDGTVVSVSESTLTAQMSDGVQHTYHLTSTAPITRNGQKSALAALRAGDEVTVTTAAGGVVTAVDAAGSFAPAATTAPTAQPATPIPAPSATPTPTTAPPAPIGPRTLDGTLVIASNMGLTAQLSDGTQRDFRPAPELRVSRNGRQSSLEALQPGDQVTLTTDADGAIAVVDAAGAYASGTQVQASSNSGAIQGTLAGAWGAGIAARLSDGVHDFGLATAPHVTRNGRASSVGALQSGDAITVTTDAAGAVSSVDAAGAPRASTTTTPAGAAAIVAPPFVALLLALGGLLYRRARKTRSAT